MITRYNNLSFLWGIPGLIIQIGAGIAGQSVEEPTAKLIAALVQLGGTALLLVGLAYYALAKGRHPAWSLMAFLSCIGLLVLYLLEDKAPAAQA